MKSTEMLTREDALAGRRWFVIDARDKVLGRVASEAARLLRGKSRPSFTPHVDCGDFVVIVNAEQVKLSGPKDKTKVYFRHTGYPGGIREQTAEQMRAAHPLAANRRTRAASTRAVRPPWRFSAVSSSIVWGAENRPSETAGYSTNYVPVEPRGSVSARCP